MTDDEMVEHYFPARWFPYAQREVAKALAAAVREAVLKRVRVCGKCDGSGGIVNGVHLMPCDTCRGCGITESEP